MKNKEKIVMSVVTLAFFFLLRHFLFYDRGLSFFEEGSFFYLYDSIAKGKILYGDVYTYTAPLANYFFALVLKIFGSELLIVRAASIILTTLGLITIFFILKEFLSNFWAWIGALVSYSMYYLWWYSYGYEFGSLFCYLTILSAYLFVKKNKMIYFILMILCSVGATGYNLIAQGIPFIFAILTMFILFRKRINYKYAILYLGSVIFINMLIFSFFIIKSSFSAVLYDLTPFLQGESSKQPFSLEGKFLFFNLLEHYNAYFPENLSPSSLYIFLKGWVYIFIYYMPILNLILFKVNYSKVFKQFNFPLQFLYLSLLFYSLFSLTRPYLFYPTGHSDAFFFSPTLLFFYINSYYVLRNICKRFDLKYVNAIKYFFVAVMAFFYLIIQVPNLNPELKQKEFNFEHIRGVKSTQNEVEFASNIIKSIKKYSDKGDYVFTRGQFVLNVVTETLDPTEKKMLIFAPLLRPFVSDESRKRVEKEFIDLLVKKNVKIVCMDTDFLERIKKNNLIDLEHLLTTRYEIKDYFAFDTSQQEHKTGGILDCHIFVLREYKNNR